MTEDQLLTLAVRIFGPKVFSRISQSQVCEALGLCDQKSMATRMGLSYEALRWRVAKGKVPKPTIRLGKRAYYSEEQAHALESQQAQLNTSGDSFMDDEDDDEHGPQETQTGSL